MCNKFAGAFLVPDDDFDIKINKQSVNDTTIRDLANHYCVSREVILRKLLDRKLITQTFYEEKVEQWKQESGKKSGKGGDYYLTKRAYLGERYLELVFSRYYQNQFSIDQLADYLGVKVQNVPGMEALLLSKGDN